MKKLNQIAVSVLAAAAVLGLTASVGTSVAAAYDSSEDPIVSVSFLYDIFKVEILDAVEDKVDKAVESRLADMQFPQTVTAPVQQEPEPTNIQYGTGASGSAGSGSAGAGAASTYDVIELKAGDALYAEGACDVMLRSGVAVCIAPDPKQGIADYTSAYEIYDGDALSKNHMCLIPRGDGRGVLAASESVYIMVRGEYTVVKGY